MNNITLIASDEDALSILRVCAPILGDDLNAWLNYGPVKILLGSGRLSIASRLP